METLCFYDLVSLVENRDAVSEISVPDKWHAVGYETAEFSGRMLCAGDEVKPGEVRLSLGVSGWYRVYFGLPHVTFATETCVGIDGFGKVVLTSFPAPDWDINEWVDEAYFGAVLLSGGITLSKPAVGIISSGLAYIKLVPMTAGEVTDATAATGGRVNFHFDEYYLGENGYETDDEFLGRVNMLAGAGGGILFHETASAGVRFASGKVPFAHCEAVTAINRGSEYYRENRARIKPKIIERAHGIGFEVYATKRIQVGDFGIPLDRQYCPSFAYEAAPQFAIKTRDGRVVRALSFAYPEVRKMAIDSLLSSMSDGEYDGVSLTFHRGVFLGFEEPVKKEVERRFGVAAERLPIADERLHGVWCGYLTAFLREVRAALDERYGKGKMKCNAIVFYDPESSKYAGFDVETWAREGLVDSVSQGLMRWREDLSGCLSSDGLIDLAAYGKEIAHRQVLVREYDGDDTDRIVSGAVAYKKILAPYGVGFFATLGWSNETVPYLLDLSTKLHAVGVDDLFSWNANHKCRDLAVIHTEKYLSRHVGAKEVPSFVTRRRVLSIDGKDVTYFNVNWNG